MPSEATLRKMLYRVRAAKGPDRELDGDLAVALDIAPGGMRMSALDGGLFATCAYTSWRAPDWTSSIDAAVALVERCLPEWSWGASHRGGLAWADVCPSSPLRMPVVAKAMPSVPLAILAALLSALLANPDAMEGGR